MAAPNLQAEGATATGVTTGVPAVTIPTHQANDILVVSAIAWVPNTAGDAAQIPTPAGGWAIMGSQVGQPAGTRDGWLACFWKRAAGAGETVTLTRGASWDTGTDTCFNARAYVVRGCAASGNPWDAVTTSGPHTAANQAFPAVTVSGPERTVIQFGCNTDNLAFSMVSTGWTTGTEDNDNGGTDSSFQTARKDNISSSTSADAATVTAPAAGAYAFIGASFKPNVITVSVGQVTETDLAQPIAWAPKHRLVAQAAEADAAQAVTAHKTKGVAQAVEADLAQTMSAPRVVSVAQTIETDLAQAVSWAPKTRLAGLATETDLAQAVGARKTKGVAQAVEADLAQTVTIRKTRSVSQAVEADLAQAVGARKTKAVAQTTEADLAQAVTRRKTITIAQAVETDAPLPVAPAGDSPIIQQAVELDAAQPIAWAPKARRVAQANEVDEARPVTRIKVAGVALVLEIDAAQALAHLKTRGLLQAAELDLAQAVAHFKTRGIWQAVETDFARPITPPVFVPSPPDRTFVIAGELRSLAIGETRTLRLDTENRTLRV